MLEQILYLRSGKWRINVDSSEPPPSLELVDPTSPWNRMRLALPGAWPGVSELQLQELARRPEVRFWADEHNQVWRISDVGPGTRFPFPLRQRHLVFDSDHASAGLVRIRDEVELGDLTNEELRDYRSRVPDAGTRRRLVRPPSPRNGAKAQRPRSTGTE